MARKRSKSSSAITVVILIVAVAVWAYDASQEPRKTPSPAKATEVANDSNSENDSGRYEKYDGCVLVPNRGNDGDSFLVRLPGDRTEILRLYFVDTPESAFKTYGGGRNNHDRIADQAKDMGGITPQQAVKIGKEAKNFTLTHLAKAPFTIHTEWDSPFNDQRYHAFVVLSYNRKPRFLHELLVEKGYARIHTKGADLPDGTSRKQHEADLRKLERER